MKGSDSERMSTRNSAGVTALTLEDELRHIDFLILGLVEGKARVGVLRELDFEAEENNGCEKRSTSGALKALAAIIEVAHLV